MTFLSNYDEKLEELLKENNKQQKYNSNGHEVYCLAVCEDREFVREGDYLLNKVSYRLMNTSTYDLVGERHYVTEKYKILAEGKWFKYFDFDPDWCKIFLIQDSKGYCHVELSTRDRKGNTFTSSAYGNTVATVEEAIANANSKSIDFEGEVARPSIGDITLKESENSRDYFNKREREINRENAKTLANGNFDDLMNSNDAFIKGFYRWSEDCHNWGYQIGRNLYIVVSYAIDSNVVNVSLINHGKKQNSWRCSTLDYDKVISLCKNVQDEYGDLNYSGLLDECKDQKKSIDEARISHNRYKMKIVDWDKVESIVMEVADYYKIHADFQISEYAEDTAIVHIGKSPTDIVITLPKIESEYVEGSTYANCICIDSNIVTECKSWSADTVDEFKHDFTDLVQIYRRTCEPPKDENGKHKSIDAGGQWDYIYDLQDELEEKGYKSVVRSDGYRAILDMQTNLGKIKVTYVEGEWVYSMTYTNFETKEETYKTSESVDAIVKAIEELLNGATALTESETRENFFEEEFARLEAAGWTKEVTDFEGIKNSKFCTFFNPQTKDFLSIEIFSNGSFSASFQRSEAYAPNPRVVAGVRVAKATLHNIVDDVLAGYGFTSDSVLPKYRNRENGLVESKRNLKETSEHMPSEVYDFCRALEEKGRITHDTLGQLYYRYHNLSDSDEQTLLKAASVDIDDPANKSLIDNAAYIVNCYRFGGRSTQSYEGLW